MPALTILRALFALASLIVLVLAAYLLWSWYDGDVVRAADGTVRRVREDWRLWTGAPLLAWSFLGRLLVLPLLAKRDVDPMRTVRGEVRTLPRTGGGQLHVETFGPDDAQPIILTHGWSLDSTMWSFAVRDLATRFRVITWDLPGLGRSTRGKDGTVSLSHMAEDLRTVVDFVGAKRPILVGHSIGGMIVQTLARDDPEGFARTVAGVVLLNTTYTNPLRTMILSRLVTALRWPVIEPMMRLTIWLEPLSWLSGWQSYLSGSAHVAVRFGFGRFVTRSQLEHTTLLLTRARPAVSAKGDLAMFRWDSAFALARDGVPVLVIGGDRDIVTKAEASRSIAARVPRSRLVTIAGVNHMGPVEAAALYNEEIAAFAATAGR
jgi:pimeloyl-ACP methyl ester carboxylesterase